MATTYEVDQVTTSPPWLQGPYGAAWASALGDVKDAVWDWAAQAVKARCPNVCPSDALSLIGSERGLERGVSEPEAQYRARLVGAWLQWQWAGTPYGMLQAFLLAGYPGVIVQCQSGMQYTLGGTGMVSDLAPSAMAAPVHLGGSPELWSDIGIVIIKPWPTWWAGVAPADGSADQKTAAALVKKWKNAHNRCVALKVVDGVLWDGGATWDGGGKWDSGSSTTWTPPVG